MADSKPNFGRMMAIIDEVFATREDPDQIKVTSEQMKKLEKLHPATLTEHANEEGPLIWVLVIPTMTALMNDFLGGKISEKAMLEKTQIGDKYNCIYLCSATTLPEYRGKGETKKMCVKAIRAISLEHPITALFVWPFTKEGAALASSVAKECKLELHEKLS